MTEVNLHSYIQRSFIAEYFEDAKQIKYLHDYFETVRQGKHIIMREFSFIKSTPWNRISFVSRYSEALNASPDEAMTAWDYHLMMELLSIDVPSTVCERITEIAASNAGLAEPTIIKSSKTEAFDTPVTVREFVNVFSVYLYYIDFFDALEKTVREAFSLVHRNRLIEGSEQPVDTPYTKQDLQGILEALLDKQRLPWPSPLAVREAIARAMEGRKLEGPHTNAPMSTVYFTVSKMLFDGGLKVEYPWHGNLDK
ncbi:hypothetical protein BC829DRAFT_394227 [Chytridium lagenaria]|nr:hypothetical protein BC829DRAFT_394227 [Chytridium lagenaria]